MATRHELSEPDFTSRRNACEVSLEIVPEEAIVSLAMRPILILFISFIEIVCSCDLRALQDLKTNTQKQVANITLATLAKVIANAFTQRMKNGDVTYPILSSKRSKAKL